MNEPPLTELREMATACATQYPPSHIVRAVGQALLALTDPTPLTAEHCREAGAGCDMRGMSQRFSFPGVTVWKEPTDDEMSCDVQEMTRGQLKLALMMEDGDE